MTNPSEKIARMTMYLTVTFTTVLPIKYCLLPVKTTFLFRYAIFIGATGLLTLVYATLCLCYNGFISKKDLESLTQTPNSRNCNVCMQLKPERAHHCSSCKQCIKKMDHHCHWLGRCVNYHNHGYFVRFLFCMLLNSAAVFLFNCYYLYESVWISVFPNSLVISTVLVLSCCSAGLLSIVSAVHLYGQLSMIINNITFIESINCYNYGFSESDSPYNLGIKHNLEDVFGPLRYFLLSSPTGDGIKFRKKYNIEYWPQHFRTVDRMSMYNSV